MQDEQKKQLSKRQKKQVEQIQSLVEHLSDQDFEERRTEAIQTARAIALAGLPKRKSESQHLSRTLKLGKDLWLRVHYSATTVGGVLPYGEDRFVLAGIQSLALERRSPVVFFDEVSELLKMFNLSTDGRTLQLLRERFERLAGLAIRLCFDQTEEGLNQARAGESSFVIQKYLLPTKEELHYDRIGEFSLPRLDPEQDHVRYGVVLSPYFWEHLKEPKNQLILPIDLMKLFINAPTGWDYASFLVHRCSRARTHSIIDHDVLMSLFKDNPKESDNQAINRIRKYHDSIMQALDGRLNANLESLGNFKSSGGRPKERWILRVGPSKKVVWSGKKSNQFGGDIPTNTLPGAK